MLDLCTFAGVVEHDHTLAPCRPKCYRWAEIDLPAMVTAGLGDRRLPIKVRCRACGELGRVQVRPPVPTRVRSVGWARIPAG